MMNATIAHFLTTMEMQKGTCVEGQKVSRNAIHHLPMIIVFLFHFNTADMIVKFMFLAEDKVFCTRLFVAALLHGCTIRKDGIFAEIECRNWKQFGDCVWSAWSRMSRTSEGKEIMKRRTAHVELPDFDEDVHVWYELSDDHKHLMYGRS